MNCGCRNPTPIGLGKGETAQYKDRNKQEAKASLIFNLLKTNQKPLRFERGREMAKSFCQVQSRGRPLIRSFPCLQTLGSFPHLLPLCGGFATLSLQPSPGVAPRYPRQPCVSLAPLWLLGFPQCSWITSYKTSYTAKVSMRPEVRLRSWGWEALSCSQFSPLAGIQVLKMNRTFPPQQSWL